MADGAGDFAVFVRGKREDGLCFFFKRGMLAVESLCLLDRVWGWGKGEDKGDGARGSGESGLGGKKGRCTYDETNGEPRPPRYTMRGPIAAVMALRGDLFVALELGCEFCPCAFESQLPLPFVFWGCGSSGG